MSNALAFLAKVLPWSKDPAVPAYFNFHYMTSSDDGKIYWNSRACLDLTDMGKTLAWLNRSPHVRDIYVCMSSQKVMIGERTGKNGFKYKIGKRSQADAIALKSLFIDVDVKNGAYKTTADASAAVNKFIRDSGLPVPSARVNSGSGGFHLHWVLTEALPVADWQPLADALSFAVQKYGLYADTQCTVDAARILRVPDTKNYKTDPPKPVTLHKLYPHEVTPDVMRQALAPYMLQAKKPAAKAAFEEAAPIRAPTAEGSELTSGILQLPIKITDVGKECVFISNALATGGADHQEPSWRNALRVASFCEDSHTAAHELSHKHAGYSADETDKKFARIVADKPKYGWPHCKTIAASGAFVECNTCPHFAQLKTPLHFATPPAAMSAAFAGLPPTKRPFILPFGYTRDQNNIIYKQQTDQSGATTEIALLNRYEILDAWLEREASDTYLRFVAVTSLGNTTTIKLAASALNSTSFGPALKHMALNETQVKHARTFMVAWIDKLKTSPAHINSNVGIIGWSFNGKDEESGFAFNNRLWTPSGNVLAECDDANIAARFSVRGKLDPWKAACELILGQGRSDLNVILASPFAGPLIAFSGESGALLSLFSTQTGVGKTTAMRCAAAVFGSKESRQTLDDTVNSMGRRMSKAPNLTVYYDEIKPAQMKDFATRIFRVTGGVDKDRANPDASIKSRGGWSTLLVSACNDSLVDYVNGAAATNSAGIARLFEGVVLPNAGNVGKVSIGEAGSRLFELDRNYGHAGLIFAQYLGKNHVEVQQEFKVYYERIFRAVNGTESERFWIVTMAALMYGAYLAKKCDLLDIPLAPMRDYLKATLNRMRGFMRDNPVDVSNKDTICNLLQQYLSATRARCTLETDHIIDRAGRISAKANPMYCANPAMIDGPYVQYARKDRKLRIDRKHMEEWFRANHQLSGAVIDGLKAKLNATQKQATIAGGTSLSGKLRSIVIDIDLNDPACLGYFDVD